MSMLDFDTRISDMGMSIPDHTKEAIEHYLIRGYHPGGFLSAVLAGEFYRAIKTADTANRQMLWVIGNWILYNAPRQSWGSYNAIDQWCDDVGNCRSNYVLKLEKQRVVDILKEQ